MADKPALTSPMVQVAMIDGSDWSVQSLNADMLRWERYAIKNRLPVNPGGAPVTWLSFLAWSAGVREHMLPSTLTYAEFADQCASVSAPDSAVPEVGPTEPVPDTD
jgi:hypothetical protein